MERYSLITETLNSNNAWMILKIAIKIGWFFKFRCSVSPTTYLGISRFLTIFEKN